MDTDLDGVAVKQCLLEHARRCTRCSTTPNSAGPRSPPCARSGALTGIVTDDGADPAVLREYREIGLEIHQAPG